MKKNIPLVILKTLHPIVEKHKEVITPIKNEAAYYHLIDKDSRSDLFFKVIKQEQRDGKLSYQLERKPHSKDFAQSTAEWVNMEALIDRLNTWIGIIVSYNSIHTIYDDPVLKSYEERIFEEINIVDDDAEYVPFELNKQILLDKYLADIQDKIEAMKKGREPEDILLLDEIKKEAQQVRKKITRMTKRDVIRKIAKLWAKAQKIGLDVLKEIVIDVSSEVVKKLVIGT